MELDIKYVKYKRDELMQSENNKIVISLEQTSITRRNSFVLGLLSAIVE